MISDERLWERLQRLSSIGRQKTGGVTRLSFTPEEKAAKDLITSFMDEAGLYVQEDAVGNLIGRREGMVQGMPTVLTGSHVDSVYNGGNFDGPLGVLASIEAAQAMSEQGINTRYPIEVVCFTDEEGARFSFGMIGSRAMVGSLALEHLGNVDEQGTSLAQALEENGFDPDSVGGAARDSGSLRAYVELHIEQGKILENENLPVGVVTGIAGPLWLKLTFTGEAGHAGTTPMGYRRDALAAAGEVVGLVEREASATGTTVGTIGQLDLSPGGVNIIPGRVELTVDLRDIDEGTRDEAERRIRQEASEICRARGITLDSEILQRVSPVACAELVKNAAIAACEQTGVQAYTLPSGAGHDAMHLAELCPIGMIFARSQAGISHNPAEYTSQEDCVEAAELLLHTLLNLAERV